MKYPKGVLEIIYDRKAQEETKSSSKMSNKSLPVTKAKESSKQVIIECELIQDRIDRAEDNRIRHESSKNFIDS
jgi:hypothetical protein